MPLTDAQEKAVHSTGKPLFIQAGAGTGKTFTLTNRLAYGLSEESGRLIPDVDNLLTITFTNKAAAELLGRVRAELRRRGLTDAALKVDAAWISTIHSMCQRILTTHAFDAGIDPGAELLSEEESNELLSMALDEVLAEMAASDELALLRESYKADKLASLVLELVGILESSPDQESPFSLGPKPRESAAETLQKFYGAACGIAAELEGAGEPTTGQKTVAKCAGLISDANEALRGLLEGAAADELSWSSAHELLAGLKQAKPGNFKKEPWVSLFSDYNESLEWARVRVTAAKQYADLVALTSLALATQERHAALKSERGSIDMGDILVKTSQLLAARPDVAREYRERFVSIMIDEFQDTDALQVDIVRRFCDEQLSALVTVGDAQQSIYGFRGADLEVYRETHKLMQSCDCDEVELKTNFRSHSGVLGYVETVFKRPEFFGGEFLQVAPGPKNDADRPWAEARDPRVSVLFSTGVEGEKKAPLSDALRQQNAVQIADAFEAFHADGASYGSMAILLRSMTHVDAYRDELRRRDIPCTISGGSTFYTAPEVKLISMLLRFLENRDDDETLFNMLGSALFDVSDDDLLALATLQKDIIKLKTPHMRRKPSMYDALRRKAKEEQDETSLLYRAYTVLESALRKVGGAPLSSIVLDVVRESGWRARLQREELSGAAVMANIYRLCDTLDESEQRYGRSVLRQAEHIRLMCDLAEEGTGARAKAGTMVMPDTAGVQIMTIHASKGLEFPIVAVAEWNTKYDPPKGSRLLTFTENGESYLALSVNKSGNEALFDEEQAAPSFAMAADQQSYLARAMTEATAKEAAESQRLLYVALTRAKDTLLIVGHDGKYANKKELQDGLQAEMLAAVFGEELPADGAVVKTDTGALVEFHCASVSRPDDDAQPEPEPEEPEAPKDERLHYLVPLGDRPVLDAQVIQKPLVYSYSNLSKLRDTDAPSPLVPQAVQLRDRSKDVDTVSPFGSAFHLVAQWIVERRADVSRPDVEARVGAAARRYSLNRAENERLSAAVDSWLTSSRFMEACSYPSIKAEQPFCVDVEGIALEGYIDLLCLDGQGKEALVIDYKTGDSGEGAELIERYRLQGQCYAYAVLASGLAERVALVFVRPEVDLEEICFEYTANDIPTLAASIIGE